MPNNDLKYLEKNLILELKKQLPGNKAQNLMSPSKRDHALIKHDNSKATISSVLILLYLEKGILNIPLIKRSTGKHKHSGQISLPGGKKEKSDANIEETALRETFEEIGINPSKINVLGELTQLYIPVSNFIVHPIIGIAEDALSFDISEYEVAELIEISINDLFNSNNKYEFVFEKNGYKIEAPYFNANGHKIWGATAMILSELQQILKNINLV